MYLELVKGKKPDGQNGFAFKSVVNGQIKKYEDNRDLVLRQMLYDLTMWYSMENRPHKTRYMSHHVQAFITAFDLDNNELTNSNVDSSDDDGPGPPTPANANAPDLIPATAQATQKPGDMRPASAARRPPSPMGRPTGTGESWGCWSS